MASTRRFELNNHSQRITQWFRSRRLNDEFADFTLWFGEKKVRCHRFILAATSPYFNEMFEKKIIRDSFCFSDLSHDDVIEVLTMIYDGSVCLPNDRLDVFERAARAFNIDLRAVSTEITDSDCTKEGGTPLDDGMC